MRRVLNVLFPILLMASTATAHGLLWVSGDHGNTLMVGHPKDSEHHGSAAVPLSSGLVTRLETCDEEGAWRYRGSPPRGPLVIEPVAASLVEVDFGWWSIGAQGVTAEPPVRAEGVLESRHTLETLKELYRPFPGWNSPFGQGLEITPLMDPFTLSQGDRFTVLVSLDGRPLEGLRVIHDGVARGRTDLAGQIRLRVRHPGWQEIVTTLYDDQPGPLHASVMHTTQLNFHVEDQE